MGKVIVRAIAGGVYTEGESIDKSLLNGVDCQDNFVDYIDDNLQEKLSSGYMDFRFEDGELWTYTTYNTKEELNQDELEQLIEYTQGQWSDGIGEGFEQFPCLEIDGNEIFVSPWHPGQVATTIQTK